MVKVFCDICGKPAIIGLDGLYSLYVTTENLHMCEHHLCHYCAEKIGLADYIKARQAESERALEQNEIISCEIQENEENEAK